jgi:hemolysin III
MDKQKVAILSKFREPWSAITHLGGAILSVFGLVYLLVLGWGDLTRVVVLLVYGLSVVTLFTASAVYHASLSGPGVVQGLRKFDHAAIYALIAGSYTPICVLGFTGFWQWGLLAIVWGLAVIGITVKVFTTRGPRWLTAGVYVLMGWISVAAVGEMTSRLPAVSLVWLVIGGVIYTLGAVVYATKKLDIKPGVFGFHEVWHIFVLLGAISHFIAIAALTAAVI